MKSLNPNWVAEPIRILGGSPIRVAVPPILEPITSQIKKGTGFSFSWSVMAKVTGTISKTVVTLSKKADKKAVITVSSTKSMTGRPLETLAAHMARNSKTPLRLVIPTIIIIPTNKPMVFQSMPAKASSWVKIPNNTINTAPARLTMARCSFSAMIIP